MHSLFHGDEDDVKHATIPSAGLQRFPCQFGEGQGPNRNLQEGNKWLRSTELC